MKIKFKLSLMGIATAIIVVLASTLIQLNRASDISRGLSLQVMQVLAEEQAEYWSGQINSHIRAMRIMADLMSGYESLMTEMRRSFYNAMLWKFIENEPDFFEISTVWRPDIIDGMDAQMTWMPGSTATGQYAIAFVREMAEGRINQRASTYVNQIMAHIDGPNAKQDLVENPVIIAVQGTDKMLLRISVPIIHPWTNAVVGMVSGQLNLDIVQPRVTNLVAQHPGIAAISIYANNGFIIASYLPDNAGRMLGQVDHMFAGRFNDALQVINQGDRYNLQGHSASLNSRTEIALVPLSIGNSDMTWTVMLAKAESQIMGPVWTMARDAIALAVALIIAAALISFFVYGKLTASIVAIQSSLKLLANGDLTSSVSIKSKDEIGELGKYFNETIHNVKTLVSSIKDETATLSEIGGDLASSMDQTAGEVKKIVDTIQNIKGRVENQSASVSQTHATMDSLVKNINKLDGQVEDQSSNISMSSSAIEQMVANTKSVSDTLTKNSANVHNLIETSEEGRGGLSGVVEDIKEIARESEGLMEINAVIDNIASQTNLLSMNAAIEAAHAGESGKGFAVVADEIRKLAENSGEQSKTIGSVLKKIKGSIDKITASTENVLKKFEAIDSSIKIVADQEENIRCAMEEQGHGSKQVLDGMVNVNEITRQVRSGSNEML
ncbi:MAG: methyl-accepting chemotaxis protein, partial [Spirochaetes bacterium]|nr:methyl-accepting chemotaxis protein [Spirochaetota bacterium]